MGGHFQGFGALVHSTLIIRDVKLCVANLCITKVYRYKHMFELEEKAHILVFHEGHFTPKKVYEIFKILRFFQDFRDFLKISKIFRDFQDFKRFSQDFIDFLDFF